MAIRSILQHPDQRLRKKASAVVDFNPERTVYVVRTESRGDVDVPVSHMWDWLAIDPTLDTVGEAPAAATEAGSYHPQTQKW